MATVRPRGREIDEAASARRVFFSYARADRASVDTLVNRVVEAGYRVWLDRRDVPPGQDFVDAMLKAVRESAAFVVMLSPKAVESSYVAQELSAAADAAVPLFPVEIQPCELPAGYQAHLGNRNRVIAYRRPKAAAEELIEALGGLRGAARVAPSAKYPAQRQNIHLMAECLRLLQEVAGGGAVVFTGGREWQAYVQFLCEESNPVVYGEAMSTENLPKEHRLTEAEQDRLRELGWNPPGPATRSRKPRAAPNHFRHWAARSDEDRYEVAGIAMTTFLEVYGHYPGEKIQVELLDLDY
jgi:hypothetical protein